MKAEFVRNAQTQFLRDTIKHYNSSNRGRGTRVCCYSPTAKSDGCAIGRHIPNKETTRWLDIASNSVNHEGTVDYLPAALVVLSLEFLSAMQSLHDSLENWEEDGLSADGLGSIGEICDVFRLDVSEVLKGTGYES